jgi:excisionase family DNA binding protein
MTADQAPQRRDLPTQHHDVDLTRRVTLSVDEAAALLGVSRDYFDKHITHELRVIRLGRRILIPVRELDRWLERSQAF